MCINSVESFLKLNEPTESDMTSTCTVHNKVGQTRESAALLWLIPCTSCTNVHNECLAQLFITLSLSFSSVNFSDLLDEIRYEHRFANIFYRRSHCTRAEVAFLSWCVVAFFGKRFRSASNNETQKIECQGHWLEIPKLLRFHSPYSNRHKLFSANSMKWNDFLNISIPFFLSFWLY